MKKYSRQREIITDSLKNRKDHPTADMLYTDLKAQMPNIGIATVYRNLVDLCEDKKIQKIKTENGPDRFDGETKNHIHFICDDCKEIYDIFIEDNKMDELQNNMYEYAKQIGGKPNNSQITIQGKCKKCRKCIAI